MFGIRYYKAGPTEFILHFRNGQVVRQGPGRSFWYYAPASTIVSVPVSSIDVPFMFNEISADFQAITLQGQLTYRIAEPARIAALLDFSVNPTGTYKSEDPQKLNERLVAATQALASAITHRSTLRELLASADVVATDLLARLRTAEAVQMLGIEILNLSILAIRPTPETAKALEAEARELLLRQADEAIYARRNSAVEQERRIKESELNTELAVELKRREIRESRMKADIAVEEQRSALLETQVKNDRSQADAKAYALEAMLAPLRQTDWRTLMAASSGQIDPRQSIAMAFRDLAENAQKIGELNISPELLASLMQGKDKK